jgi:hypothetical protein
MTRSSINGSPCLESLEQRLMLDGAVSAMLGDGHLYIVGDAGDNAIVLEGLDNGGYRIIGMPTAGGDTLVNGMPFQEVGPINLRVKIDLGGGDDTLNVGSLKGVDTTISNIVDYEGGSGVNTLNVGRIQNIGSLQFAGQVTMNGMVDFDNDTFGTGNVLITGARMSSFNANLGYGEGDRSVVIADLWHGLIYHPPSEYYEVASGMGTGLTITNPYGRLDSYIADTYSTHVNITSANGDDDLVFRGVRFNTMAVSTYTGEDFIEFSSSEYGGNRISEGLEVYMGHHTDSLWMSDTHVSSGTMLDMGRGGARHAGQMLQISAHAGCELSDLTINGENVWAEFNGIAGVNETLIHGELNVFTHPGRGEDQLGLRNVRVLGGVSVGLDGGDDSVWIHDSSLSGMSEFYLGLGNDTFLVGQTMTDLVPGDATRFENVVVDMGYGSDQVGISNATASGLLFVNLGESSGRGQRARIATIGGTVTAGNLGVAGVGKTNVFIGNTEVEEPSVIVDGILSIATGMDTSRDNVSVLNVDVGGEVGISTGGGTDVVALQRSTFGGPVMVHLGDGVDILSIWDSHFMDDVEFFGGRMRDWFWVLDSTFEGDARFNGGHGRNRINRDLMDRNVFLAGSYLSDMSWWS